MASKGECHKCNKLVEFTSLIPPICPDCNLMVDYPPCEECGAFCGASSIRFLRGRAFCLDCILK